MRGKNPAKVPLEGEEVAVTAVTYHEVMAGVKRKKARNEEQFFNRLFLSLPVLGFDREAAEESGGIAARLA